MQLNIADATMFLNWFFSHENMKKPTGQPAQNQPKSQFLFHENLPPRDLPIMTLNTTALIHVLRGNTTPNGNNPHLCHVRTIRAIPRILMLIHLGHK